MLYLAYIANCIRQATIVMNRFGFWKSGFVCDHILLTISNTDVGWTTATEPISSFSITTRSTCTEPLLSEMVISSISLTLELRSFPSHNRNYFPYSTRN